MKPLYKNLLLLLVLIPSITYSQVKKRNSTNLTGYVYQTPNGNDIPFKFTVAYKTDQDGYYVTAYKVFIDGNYKFDVVAKHNPIKKSIDVEVDVAGGGLFAAVAEPQNATYQTPVLTAFGYKGAGRVLGGSYVPNQLSISFTDNSFTYVNVINVLGYHGNDGADYFVFDNQASKAVAQPNSSIIPVHNKKPIPPTSTSTKQEEFTNKGLGSIQTSKNAQVVIKFSKTGFQFIYSNHESQDILVNLTPEEYVNGAIDQDYKIDSGTIKEVYYVDTENKIQVDFRNGNRIIFEVSNSKAN